MAEIDLDGFERVAPLGSGGLGDVYRATRTSTGGQVAIKILRDWTDRDLAWQRAQRELRALVDLRGHSNVVNVEEVIDSDGVLAIVMEYAPGGSVHDLLGQRGGRLGFGETLLVATHTAAALAAAHDRGIIHRDIKPHNLLIGAFGQVKVCDFGIASLTRSESVRERTSSLSLRYASPEELRGEQEVGTPSDIYSLAATLHQLLTGQYLPLPDGTAGTIPLRSWQAPDDVPADVELDVRSLVVRSGDRRPDARPTAAELQERFEELSGRLGAGRVRALPLVTPDGDDATVVGALDVGGAAAADVVMATPPGAPSPAESPVPTAAATSPNSSGPPTGTPIPPEPSGDPGATVVRPGAVAAGATTVGGVAGAATDATSAMSAPPGPPAGPPPGAPPTGPAGPGGPSDEPASSGRTALAIFAVLALVLGGVFAAFALGWIGGGGDDATAATTAPGGTAPPGASTTTSAATTSTTSE
ncbi:MAG: serine/threonine-protein kinase, partial [Actinomycetota bacterium]